MISHHPSKFGGHGHGDVVVEISFCKFDRWYRKTKSLKSHVTLKIETLNVSHHPAKSGDHRKWGSWDITLLVCDLARSLSQRVKWFYGWEPLIVSYYTAKFDGYRHCDYGNIAALICLLISRDQVTQEPCDFLVGVPQGKSLLCQVWWL